MRRGWWAGVALLGLGWGLWADSAVRIVRLSYVGEGVELWQPGAGWRAAALNAPLVEGMRVRSDARGKAEIELECGSTARLWSNSELALPEMRLEDSGIRITEMRLDSGSGWFDVRRGDSPKFGLEVGEAEATTPEGAAVFRLDAGGDLGKAVLRVKAGMVRVRTAGFATDVGKAEQLQWAGGSPEVGRVVKGAADGLDQWNEARENGGLRGRFGFFGRGPNRGAQAREAACKVVARRSGN